MMETSFPESLESEATQRYRPRESHPYDQFHGIDLLVTALVDMGVDVQLLYPEDETNDDLKVAADSAGALTVATCRGWISDSFSQKAVLPEAVFTFQSDEKTHSTKLAQWHDERYGDCYVANDANIFTLITERSPQNPNTHRLEMKSSNEGALRAYAEVAFSLIVPTW